MNERASLLPAVRTVLRDPLCDIALAPHTTLRKLARWLREARHLRDLVGALAAHAEQSAYLGSTHEFHGRSMTVTLDSVKPWWFNALDTVKRRNL
jgi:hypothetical protein